MRKFVLLTSRAVGSAALASTLVLAGLLLISSSADAAPLSVELGTAGNYSVLGGTGVVNTLNSVLNADLGVSPSTSITGFPPGIVEGVTHAGDTQAAQAQSDLVLAYNAAAGLSPTRTFSGDQIGATFDAGVYSTAAAFALTGTMTLDGQGDPNAVFVFQVNAALNTAAGTTISLINGAQASNVFWQVNGAVTTGAASSFSGTIMAAGAITVGAGGSIAGRALSSGVVTLAGNVITTPDIVTFAVPPTPTSSLTNTMTDSVGAAGIPGDAGSITYTSMTSSICTVNAISGALTYLTTGWCTIQATQAADAAHGDALTTAVTNITVTAPPSFTVTFNGNGSSAGSTPTETANVPSALNTNGFGRSGFTFSGWNTSPLGIGTPYTDGALYSFSAAVTLYAQWTADPSFTVTFNGNGSSAGSTPTETANVPSALNTNGFGRSGFTFSGWNTSPLGIGTPYTDGALYSFSAAVTLYAQWTADPSFTVTFNGNGSSAGSTPTETANVPSALNTNGFGRSGFTFSGWNTSPLGIGTPYTDGALYSFSAAVTLYAQWTADPPVITGVTAAFGPTVGGTRVIVTGNNFAGATMVDFGAVASINFVVVNSTTIAALSPAGAAGLVDVTVTTPGGTSSPGRADTFTYVSAVPIALIQGSPVSATVADGGGYSGQRAVTNGIGTVSYTETLSGASTYVVVTTTGKISASTSLPPGTYSVSGDDSDTNGDIGTWIFSLTVAAAAPTVPADTGGNYDLVGSDGGVFVFGPPGTGFYGSLPGIGVNVNNIVGIVTTGDNKGYYLVGSDGGVFAFGDATFYGSLPGIGVHVNDIVGIALTANGGGYFLVAKDGGVFTFGNAPFEGSLPGLGIHVNNIVGFAAVTGDQGYWIVGSAGLVYAFGDATNLGSALGPVTAMTSTPSGQGYWLTGPDGGVFSFGDAPFQGSLPGIGVKVNNIISMVPSSDGKGYLLIGTDGGVFAFGDALFEGSLPGIGIHVTNIVGAVPTKQG